MLSLFPFTSINEILPFLMGVLGLLMTWELHDLGVRAGRIKGLDISDPSVVRTWFRNHSRARMDIYTTPEDSSACNEEVKLAEVARMVADIGHDLNNLLTPIMLGASLVQGRLEECERKLPQLDPEQTRATLVQSKEILMMILTGARRIQDRVREISDSVKG